MRGLRLGLRALHSQPYTGALFQPSPANWSITACNVLNRSFHSDAPVLSEANGTGNAASSPGSAETPSSSPEVQRIHHELMETMKGHCIPKSALVSLLLKQCSTPADIKLAMEAIARLRATRAVQGHQLLNFNKNLSQQVVEASLRVKDPENALKTIWSHNIYGFTPCLEAAHQILAYARDQQDLLLMKRTLKTMVSNSLSPTRTTADIALRLCKEQGNESLLFSLAKEYHENGVKLRPDLYDLCIATAANAGEAKHVLEIQRWRAKFRVPFTTASTFALSKAHLLKGQPKDAAQLIHNRVQESEERDMYLRVLVKAWPTEVLSRRKRSINEASLRTDMEIMLKELKALGSGVAVDADQDFGTGKETLRKVVYS